MVENNNLVSSQHFLILKKKILCIGYFNTVVAFVAFCLMTIAAVRDLEDGEQESCIGRTSHSWPTWQTSERGVFLAAVAIIDGGQVLVSAMLVLAVHQVAAPLATPWLLHTALWLPAQALAGLTAAPMMHRALLALGALALLAVALLLWLSACRAIRDFQRICCSRLSGSRVPLT